MNLDLSLLETFVVVADTHSFSGAASKLYLTQQAVSARIQRLEEQLSAELFARTTRRVELTAAGELLLHHATPLLNQVRNLVELMGQPGEAGHGSLTIGYTRSCSWLPLPRALQTLKDELPLVEVLTQEMYESEISSALADGVVDFGITRTPVPLPGVTRELLSVEPLLFAMSAHHPLADEHVLSVADVADSALLLWPRHLNPGYFDVVVRIWADAGVTPDIDIFSTGTSLWSRVSRDEGITLVAQSMKGHLPRDTVAVPIAQFAEIGASLIYSDTQSSDVADRALAAILAARSLGAFRPLTLTPPKS